MRLALLLAALSASIPSSGETFTLGRYEWFQTYKFPNSALRGSADMAMVCRDDPGGLRPCKETDPIEALHQPASLELSCQSEVMQIESYVWPKMFRDGQPSGLVRMTYQGRAMDMPHAVARQIARGREVRSALALQAPIDVWAGPTNRSDKTPVGEECGVAPILGFPTECEGIQTSIGPVHISDLLDDRSKTRFQASRESIWKFLEDRQEQSDRYDRGESAEPEEGALQMILYSVTNPKVPKMEDRKVFRRGEIRHGPPAGEYLLLGKQTWRDIEVSPPPYGPGVNSAHFSMAPKAAHRELNRLQTFYNDCLARSAEIDVSSIPLGPAALDARDAVRLLRNVAEEWNLWKDVTLERFASAE